MYFSGKPTLSAWGRLDICNRQEVVSMATILTLGEGSHGLVKDENKAPSPFVSQPCL